MTKAVIFDCFGVLIGSGFKDTYASAGGNSVKDKVFIDSLLDKVNHGRISSQEMVQTIAHKLSISTETWRRVASGSETVNQPLLDYIKRLKKSYKTAILSNANIGTLQHRFSEDQMELFDVVVVSAEVGMVKPDPEIYKYTAKKLGLSSQECIFIDDSPAYCEAARAVGMKAITYRGIKQFEAECRQLLSLS